MDEIKEMATDGWVLKTNLMVKSYKFWEVHSLAKRLSDKIKRNEIENAIQDIFSLHMKVNTPVPEVFEELLLKTQEEKKILLYAFLKGFIPGEEEEKISEKLLKEWKEKNKKN